MAIRVGWLPTGTQSAEDTRAATGMLMTASGLLVPASGVIPAPAQQFALTSTGSLSCSVGAGQCMVVPGATTNQGAYPVTVDASGSGLPTVTFAAGGSLARTDVIYLQVQDTGEDGSGFTRGQVAVIQGTNGGGVPSTPAGTLALWQVPVPATATSINFATAGFVAAPTVALGGVTPSGNSAFPTFPFAGRVRARTDRAGTAAPGPLEVFDGTNWNPAQLAAVPLGIKAVPIATTANGTVTSGTTDTLDTVLGTYTFAATAGRRYRIVIANLVCNGSVAADLFAVRVRNGGASTPTTASPAVLDSSWTCVVSGSSGRVTLTLEETFLASTTGTATLGLFLQRISGTGVLTPLSPAVGGSGATGSRKLWAEDAGNV